MNNHFSRPDRNRLWSALIWAVVLAWPVCDSKLAYASFGAAEFSQMLADCRNSGGTPSATNYNAWVDGGGCICNGRSGQATCNSGSSGSSGGSGDLNSLAGEALAKGIIYGDANMTGLGIAALLLSAGSGDSQADASRRAEQASQAAEQSRREEAERQRLAEQERQAELQRQEEAKQRILGALKGAESSGELGLKLDSEQPLLVATRRDFFGSTAVVPVGPGSLSAGGMQLKLGDDAERSSAQARSGFDTAGKMLGTDTLPPPPLVPRTYPIDKLKKVDTFKAAIKKGEEEEKRLQALLDKLRQSGNSDDSAVKDVQLMIEAKAEDNKKLEKEFRDFTAEDDPAEADLPRDVVQAKGGQ